MNVGVKSLFKTLVTTTTEHAPGILTGLGVAGMVASVVLAIEATPKAMKKIEDAKKELHKETLTPVEIVKVTWKTYIPTVSMTVLSGACVLSGNHINGRRNAALAAAYTLSDQAFREYQNKVVETLGEKKEYKIRSDIAQEKANREPINDAKLLVTGHGQMMCFDSISSRTFMHDYDKLRSAANEINRRMRDEYFISLNDWYDEIGLPHLKPLGYDLGWNIDRGYIDLEFDSILIDGTPCLYIGYRVMPKYGYQ